MSSAGVLKRLLILMTLVAVLALRAPAEASAKIRVACVGDSITIGKGVKESLNWVSQLQLLLGDRYDVRNYGVDGRTLLKQGDFPYWKEQALQQATDLKPNIVIIMLGTNDSRPQNFGLHGNQFRSDFKALIAHFSSLPTHPRVWLALPPPVTKNGMNGITETVLAVSIRPLIRKVALETHSPTIDIPKALASHPEYFPDTVHPNADGDRLIAETIFGELTGLPVIEPSGGVFADQITISAKPAHPNDQILYTIDGSEPTLKSPLYRGALTLHQTTTLKVRSVSAGRLSPTSSHAVFTQLAPIAASRVGKPLLGMRYEYFVGNGNQLADRPENAKLTTVGKIPTISIPNGIADANYLVRYTGLLKVPADGLYTLAINSDDGSRLWISNQRVIDNWGGHGPLEEMVQLPLKKGYYPIKVMYFQGGGGKLLDVTWSSPNLKKQSIPAKALFHK